MRSVILKTAGLIALLIAPSALFAADASPVTAKIYGYTKLDAAYDTQRTYFGNASFYVYPRVADKNDNELNITARDTRIGLNIDGPETPLWKTTGKFEIDFYNGGAENASLPRLRLAYVDLAFTHGFSLRAGQDWDAFHVLFPQIVDVSFLGATGHLYRRSPQLRLTQEFGGSASKLTVRAAAVRNIGADIDGGGQDDGADNGSPVWEGALIYDASLWTKKQAKIFASGLSGTETVDTVAGGAIVNPDTANYDTWAAIGGILLPVTETVALQGEYWQGANLDTYYGGILQGINKTLNRSIAGQGGWGQIIVDLSKTISVDAGYGWDDPKDEDLSAAADRTLNTRAFASIFFKLDAAVTVGFEYANMRTEFKGLEAATNNRFQGSMTYRF